MRSRFRVFIAASACIFVLILIALLILSFAPPGYTPPSLPNPNGYLGIVKATQSIVDASDFPKLDSQQLEALVRSNSAAVAFVRSNLSEQIQVPLGYSVNFSSTHLADLAGLKRIAHALAAEGRFAQIQNRPAEAAKCDLDIIRLGVKCPQGGLLIDALIGAAVETIGTSELQKLTGTLDADTAKNATRELEEIEAQKQTWKQVLQQEHYWSARTFTGFPYLIARLFSFNSTRKVEAKGERRYKLTTKNTRTLMINLAARAYTLDNGHAPAKTADLVPAYLKAVPLDAMTGANMTYLP